MPYYKRGQRRRRKSIVATNTKSTNIFFDILKGFYFGIIKLNKFYFLVAPLVELQDEESRTLDTDYASGSNDYLSSALKKKRKKNKNKVPHFETENLDTTIQQLNKNNSEDSTATSTFSFQTLSPLALMF